MKRMPRSRTTKNYIEFWAYYLLQHQHRWNRILHVVGAFLGIGIAAILYPRFGALSFLCGLIGGYTCAWFGHLYFEKNRPATWRYPVYSFFSEFRMVLWILSGKIKV